MTIGRMTMGAHRGLRLGRLLPAGSLLLLCLAAADVAGQAQPAGPSFHVGSGVVTVADPEVAVAADGNFFVTWHVFFSAYRRVAVYDRLGTLLNGFVASGSEFVAPQADVTSLAPGEFVVVWLPYSNNGEYVVLRRWGLDGSPLSEEIVANEISTPHFVDNPVVRGRPPKDFLVVWDSSLSVGGDGDGSSIQGRRFDPAGPPLTGQFQINTTGSGDQERPAVAVQSDGGFLIAWESASSPGGDGDGAAIVGRRYDAGGNPVAGDFQLNAQTTGNQRRPTVAALPGGGYVASWDSESSAGTDEDLTSIQMRWFDALGQPMGPDEQVNQLVEGHQTSPDVAVTSEGLVEILWRGPDAQRRTYGSDGLPLSDQETVSDNPSGAAAPDLGTGPNGGFVVAWVDSGYPDDVYARRYVSPVFSDGFESGDTSAWAATVP